MLMKRKNSTYLVEKKAISIEMAVNMLNNLRSFKLVYNTIKKIQIILNHRLQATIANESDGKPSKLFSSKKHAS